MVTGGRSGTTTKINIMIDWLMMADVRVLSASESNMCHWHLSFADGSRSASNFL